MIQINLLPEELRQLEKTPLGRLIIVMAGVALATTALFIFLVLQFKTLPEALRKKSDTTSEIRQKEELVLEYDKLETEINFFKLRITTVQQIKRERFIWSKKLFELHRVIESAPDIALNNISIEQGRGSRMGPSKMEIIMEGYSVVPELSSVADFMTKIRTSEFFKGCEDIKTEGVDIRTKSGSPQCSFTLRVILKPQQVQRGRGGGR